VSISEIISATSPAATPFRRQARVALPTLSQVAPGQLWLRELAPQGPVPEAVTHVLQDANVVIYDRALTDAVADALPLGTYAEPAVTPETAAARSVRFARDGWSVVRLLPARLPLRERTRRVQDLVDELAAAKVLGQFPVSIVAEAPDGIEEHVIARFDDLAAIVASFPRDTPLTIVIDAFGGGAAARLHAVATNGLAG